MRSRGASLHISIPILITMGLLSTVKTFWSLETRALRTKSFRASIRHLSHISSRLYSASSSHSVVSSVDPNEEINAPLRNFITSIIDEDLRQGRNQGRVLTRFPPEPNGYLHLGHAKSILLNFDIAKQYGGKTNMRFDDTNPAKEDMEYVRSILEDVRWVVTGSTQSPDPWDGSVRHASDYFDTCYACAEHLIAQGLAYVDDLSADELRDYRGTLTEGGRDSTFRSRSPTENLHLFRLMRDGAFPDGQCVLRAKIDMSSPNMNMRDPTLYRIKRYVHPVTQQLAYIYPMYDYAHVLSDLLEGISHSICTLEFADHRPLYDWIVSSVLPSGLLPPSTSLQDRPYQYEFARLNIQHTVLSKRKLIRLVDEGLVQGWDDPRLPTIAGLRRRGVPARALKRFVRRIGMSRSDSGAVPYSVLEECVRCELDETALRFFCVQQPLKVTITNLPRDQVLRFPMHLHPRDAGRGSRDLVFNQNIFIDRQDFFDTGSDGTLSPPKGYKRLVPGGTLRLKYGPVIICDKVLRDAEGQVTSLECRYDPSSLRGAAPTLMPKPKGIVQWLSPLSSSACELRIYDKLFTAVTPGTERSFLEDLNPRSLQVITNARVEDSVLQHVDFSMLRNQPAAFQFERVGYFSVDRDSEQGGRLVFNRVVTLKEGWKPE